MEAISKREGIRAAAALERVRAAGRVAKREGKQRVGVVSGSVVCGALGWAESTGKWDGKLGPVHVSLFALPLAFATMVSKGGVARQIEAAAGPLLGVAAYKLAQDPKTVLGGEYDNVAGQYG